MPIKSTSGSKELSPLEVQKNREISSLLSSIYIRWGYEEISPPMVERLETLVAGGGISNSEIVKIVSDIPIGLRPEMTASISRASTRRFANKVRPLRLWYTGTVFKNKETSDNKLTIEENLQSGVELFGISNFSAEIELLYILLDSLDKLDISESENPILLIGHKTLFNIIIDDLDPANRLDLSKLLSGYDLVGIQNLNINEEQKNRILRILTTRGDPKDVIEVMEDLYGNRDIFNELKRLFSIITSMSNKHKVKIQLDPTYLSSYDLYTGIIFQLTCTNGNAPETIASGGRYDDLVNLFGENGQSGSGAGFSFEVDKIRELQLKGNTNKILKEKVLITYSPKRKYEDALDRQVELHNKGMIAMVEFEACDSEQMANALLEKRGYDRIEWIN